jgi:phosphate-selective porin OprO/OprP
LININARSDGMSLSRMVLVSSTAAWVVLAGASSAHAQSGVGGAVQREIDTLKRQIQSLEKRLDTVTKEAEQSKSDAAKASADAAAAKSAAQAKPQSDGDGWQITAKDGRPRFVSPDGNFSLAITSRIHFDVADYFQPKHTGTDTRQFPDLNSGYNLRRGRIGVLGTFMKDWDYNLTYDIGGSNDNTAAINQATITYKGFGPLRLQVGYVDLNYDFANGMSSNNLPLIEAPSASNVSGNVTGGTRAAFGAYVVGDRYFGELYYVGSAPGTSVNDEQVSALARFAYRPVQDDTSLLHIGVNGSYIFQPNQTSAGAAGTHTQVEFNDRPELRVSNNSLIDTTNGAQFINARNAYTAGVELAGSHRNFWVDGGYYWYGATQAKAPGAPAPNLNFTGYYVEGGWVVTGEQRPYDKDAASWGGIRPARPFSLANNGFGAVELAGRYGVVDLNDHVAAGLSSASTGGVFGGKQSIAVVGVNWYPIYNVRFMLDYFFTTVNKMSIDGKSQIGQSFQAVALRSQLQF